MELARARCLDAKGSLISAAVLTGWIQTGVLPQTSKPQANRSQSTEIAFDADQLIVGSEQHLECFERIVADAKSDVFVLSTFVAAQADERGREQRERIWRALEEAVSRGVRCHLFYGDIPW